METRQRMALAAHLRCRQSCQQETNLLSFLFRLGQSLIRFFFAYTTVVRQIVLFALVVVFYRNKVHGRRTLPIPAFVAVLISYDQSNWEALFDAS